MPSPGDTSGVRVADLGLAENDTQPTIGRGGRRVWIYPRETKGPLTRRRGWVAWALLFVYLGVPWLRWDGAPLLQVDVFARRLLLFGNAYYPQDIILFLPGFLAFIVFVFLFTAKYGRAWCGWACPQTVFLQFVFAPIERLVEGRAHVRRARDDFGFTPQWLARKVFKHALFLAVAAVIGNTALAYFWGRDNVLWALTNPPSENPAGFAFVVGFTAVFYWVFAFFKEQACVIVCPYAKFQSVLLDDRSLVVGYDTGRGEPRGRGAKDGRAGLGDCVDCGHCVQVCPTGIDIRKGQQLECIACTRCIDACDTIMEAWKKPAGLIRYDSQAGLEGRKPDRARLRLVAYGLLATVLAAVSATLIVTRPDVSVDAIRRGAEPYYAVGADSVLNTFTVQVRNKGRERRTLTLGFGDDFPGRHNWHERPFAVGSGQLRTLQLDVVVARDAFVAGRLPASLRVGNGGDARRVNITLAGPMGGIPRKGNRDE